MLWMVFVIFDICIVVLLHVAKRLGRPSRISFRILCSSFRCRDHEKCKHVVGSVC